MMVCPKTPTLDKMLEVHDESQTIGEFIEWLNSTKNARICKLNEDNFMAVSFTSTEDLLAEYFGINLKVAEVEKRALLEYQKEINKKTSIYNKH